MDETMKNDGGEKLLVKLPDTIFEAEPQPLTYSDVSQVFD
jgi:hypothetical protein